MPESTEAEIEIAATPERIMAVIADIPEYPQWCPGVQTAQVKSTLADGLLEREDAPIPVLDFADAMEGPIELGRQLVVGGGAFQASLEGRALCAAARFRRSTRVACGGGHTYDAAAQGK